MAAGAKRKPQKQVRQLQCIDHIPYYLSGFLEVAGCNTSFTAFLGIYVVVNFFLISVNFYFSIVSEYVMHANEFKNKGKPKIN